MPHDETPKVLDPGPAPGGVPFPESPVGEALTPPPLPVVEASTPPPVVTPGVAAAPSREEWITPEMRQHLEETGLGRLTLADVFGTAGLALSSPALAAQSVAQREGEQQHAQSLLAQLQSYADTLQRAQITQETALSKARQDAENEEFKFAAHRYLETTKNLAGMDLSKTPPPSVPFGPDTFRDYDRWGLQVAPLAEERQRKQAKAKTWDDVMTGLAREVRDGVIADKAQAVEIAKARLAGAGFLDPEDETLVEGAVSPYIGPALQLKHKFEEARRRALEQTQEESKSRIRRNDAAVAEAEKAILDGDPNKVLQSATAIGRHLSNLRQEYADHLNNYANASRMLAATGNTDPTLQMQREDFQIRAAQTKQNLDDFQATADSLLARIDAQSARFSIRETAPLLIADTLSQVVAANPGQTLASVLREATLGTPDSRLRGEFWHQLIIDVRASFGDSVTPFDTLKALEESIFAQAQAAAVPLPPSATAEGVLPPGEEDKYGTQFSQTTKPEPGRVQVPGYTQGGFSFSDKVRQAIYGTEVPAIDAPVR